MQGLKPGRLLGWLGALALVACTVPAAGEPSSKLPPTFRIAVCIFPMGPSNCGPDRPGRGLRVDNAATNALKNGKIPSLAKKAGTVTAFLPSGKKVFSCPGPCWSDTLPSGTRVKIRAVPHQEPYINYIVEHTVGCDLTDAKRTCELTLTSDTTVTIVFASQRR
jgi:hypothetical protein